MEYIRQKSNRINEIDFMKSVFIILMITFHIVYIGDMYPYVKRFVYTFLMPAFLLISGYLLNVEKNPKEFSKTMIWLFVPYAIMECFYVFSASIFPIREHIQNLTFNLLVDKIIVHPMGPYWYLHTLILCSCTYYVIVRLPHLSKLSVSILYGLCVYFYSYYLHIVSFWCASYFMVGFVIRCIGISFLDVIRPSTFSIIPLILIGLYPDNLDKSTVASFFVTYLIMSVCLFVYNHVNVHGLRSLTLFIGRNTLPILLFSPVFTILSKLFLPLFSFDCTGMIFLLSALVFIVVGSFSIALLFDKSGISKIFFGMQNILK